MPINLKIKLKNDHQKVEFPIEIPDDFIISKNDAKFQQLVQQYIDQSKMEEIDQVKVFANFEI